jgi:transposase
MTSSSPDHAELRRANEATQRNLVERAINKLKDFRAVATSDKRAYIFAGSVEVAPVRIWLRDTAP